MASRANTIRPRPAAYVRRSRIRNVVTLLSIVSLALLIHAMTTGTLGLAYLGLTVQHGSAGAFVIASLVVALPLFGAFQIVKTVLWYSGVLNRLDMQNR